MTLDEYHPTTTHNPEPHLHTGRLTTALNTIHQCWAAMYPDGPPPTTTGTIGRTNTRPLPIPTPTIHAPDGTPGADVTHVLASWALTIADTQHLTPTIRCTQPRPHTTAGYICGCNIAPGTTNLNHHLPATDAPALCAFLRTHVDTLATLGPDPLTELEDAADAVRKIAEPAGAREFAGPCETCGHDLRTNDGITRCQNCRTVVDTETIRDQLVAIALDRILTATELATIAPRLWPEPPTKASPTARWDKRIQRWVKAGDLQPAGHVTIEGRQRDAYRVRDINDLLARRGPRP